MLTVDSLMSDEVNSEIQPGERILWTGRPQPLRYVMRDMPRILGALGTLGIGVVVLLVFSQFWNGMGVGFRISEGFNPFAQFNTMFLLVAVLIILGGVGPAALDYLKAGRIVYAITDQRLLIITLPALWWGRSVQSYGQHDLRAVARRMHGDDIGDVVFSSESYQVRSKYGHRTRTREVGFFGVPEARRVEQLILDTFKEKAA